MSTPLPDVPVVAAPDPVAPDAPVANLPGQIALAFTAVATIVGFIWHKDFTSILPALGTLATAVIGAALAIEHAIKYKAHTTAVARYNSALLETHYASRAEPGAVVTRLIQQ